jgi:hypothetical protein
MNSLYGRFGMSPILKSSLMIDSYLIPKLVGEKGIENILTNINLGKKSLITVNEDFSDNISINVAIASAVTSQSRVFMSYFKNNPGLTGKLFYSDTDSIYIEKELPKHLVDSKGLGLMKLENILIKFISLGPKVYGGLTTDGFEFTKVKGLKEAVSLKDLESLLFEDNKKIITQEKWYKSLIESSIHIRDDNYTLTPTYKKRNLVFKKGKLIGTENIFINKIIINKDSIPAYL